MDRERGEDLTGQDLGRWLPPAWGGPQDLITAASVEAGLALLRVRSREGTERLLRLRGVADTSGQQGEWGVANLLPAPIRGKAGSLRWCGPWLCDGVALAVWGDTLWGAEALADAERWRWRALLRGLSNGRDFDEVAWDATREELRFAVGDLSGPGATRPGRGWRLHCPRDAGGVVSLRPKAWRAAWSWATATEIDWSADPESPGTGPATASGSGCRPWTYSVAEPWIEQVTGDRVKDALETLRAETDDWPRCPRCAESADRAWPVGPTERCCGRCGEVMRAVCWAVKASPSVAWRRVTGSVRLWRGFSAKGVSDPPLALASVGQLPVAINVEGGMTVGPEDLGDSQPREAHAAVWLRPGEVWPVGSPARESAASDGGWHHLTAWAAGRLSELRVRIQPRPDRWRVQASLPGRREPAVEHIFDAGPQEPVRHGEALTVAVPPGEGEVRIALQGWRDDAWQAWPLAAATLEGVSQRQLRVAAAVNPESPGLIRLSGIWPKGETLNVTLAMRLAGDGGDTIRVTLRLSGSLPVWPLAGWSELGGDTPWRLPSGMPSLCRLPLGVPRSATGSLVAPRLLVVPEAVADDQATEAGGDTAASPRELSWAWVLERDEAGRPRAFWLRLWPEAPGRWRVWVSLWARVTSSESEAGDRSGSEAASEPRCCWAARAVTVSAAAPPRGLKGQGGERVVLELDAGGTWAAVSLLNSRERKTHGRTAGSAIRGQTADAEVPHAVSFGRVEDRDASDASQPPVALIGHAAAGPERKAVRWPGLESDAPLPAGWEVAATSFLRHKLLCLRAERADQPLGGVYLVGPASLSRRRRAAWWRVLAAAGAWATVGEVGLLLDEPSAVAAGGLVTGHIALPSQAATRHNRRHVRASLHHTAAGLVLRIGAHDATASRVALSVSQPAAEPSGVPTAWPPGTAPSVDIAPQAETTLAGLGQQTLVDLLAGALVLAVRQRLLAEGLTAEHPVDETASRRPWVPLPGDALPEAPIAHRLLAEHTRTIQQTARRLAPAWPNCLNTAWSERLQPAHSELPREALLPTRHPAGGVSWRRIELASVGQRPSDLWASCSVDTRSLRDRLAPVLGEFFGRVRRMWYASGRRLPPRWVLLTGRGAACLGRHDEAAGWLAWTFDESPDRWRERLRLVPGPAAAQGASRFLDAQQMPAIVRPRALPPHPQRLRPVVVAVAGGGYQTVAPQEQADSTAIRHSHDSWTCLPLLHDLDYRDQPWQPDHPLQAVGVTNPGKRPWLDLALPGPATVCLPRLKMRHRCRS